MTHWHLPENEIHGESKAKPSYFYPYFRQILTDFTTRDRQYCHRNLSICQ